MRRIFITLFLIGLCSASAEAKTLNFAETTYHEFIQWNPLEQDLATSDEKKWGFTPEGGSTGTSGGGDSRLKDTTRVRDFFFATRNQMLEGLESTDWYNHADSKIKNLFSSRILPQNPVKELSTVKLYYANHCFLSGRRVDLLWVSDASLVCIGHKLGKIEYQNDWKKIASLLLKLDVQEAELFSQSVKFIENHHPMNTEDYFVRAYHMAIPAVIEFNRVKGCYSFGNGMPEPCPMSYSEWNQGQNRTHPDGRIFHHHGDLSVICEGQVD